MKRVKVKKKISSLASLCETLIQENKDLRVQVAHLQDELEIYKKYWNEHKKEPKENE